MLKRSSSAALPCASLASQDCGKRKAHRDRRWTEPRAPVIFAPTGDTRVMSQINYQCLRGKVHAVAPAQPAANLHLWVIVDANGEQWFATINVRSDKDALGEPAGKSDLYYLVDADRHRANSGRLAGDEARSRPAPQRGACPRQPRGSGRSPEAGRSLRPQRPLRRFPRG
jgi:hypothetical protein